MEEILLFALVALIIGRVLYKILFKKGAGGCGCGSSSKSSCGSSSQSSPVCGCGAGSCGSPKKDTPS